MIQEIKKAVYKHGYIFIAAAWLYTISFLFTNYFSYSSSPKKVSAVLEGYIKKQEQRFADILKDTAIVGALVNDGMSPLKEKMQDDVFGVFCYKAFNTGDPEEIYWNNNTMSVDREDILKLDGYYFVTYQDGSFDFIKQTIAYKGKRYIIACLIPVRWQFFFTNKYLQPRFENYTELEDKYVISNDADANIIHNSKGAALFGIKSKQNVNNDQPGAFSTILRVLAVILLIVFINSIATDIVPALGFLKAFLFLITVVVTLRYLTYHFPVPFDFRKLKLFDPLVYGSSRLNKSLGDLLINSVLLFWITSFIKFQKPRFFQKGYTPNKEVMTVLTVISLTVLMFILYLFESIISSLVINSKVQFEVTNFFTLDVSIIISFVIVCLLFLSFYYLSHLLIKPLLRSQLTIYRKLMIMAIIGLVFVTVKSFYEPAGINLIILLWFIIYITILEYRKKDTQTAFIESPFFLFWAIFFMVSATALLAYQVKTIELKKRKTIASNYALQTDEQTLQLLDMSLSSLDNSFFINSFLRFHSENKNKFIKDSLISNNFSGSLNKYETHIYTYDVVHNPLYNEDSTSYNVIKTIIQEKAKKTDIPNLYYYENALDGFSYIYEKEVYESDSALKGSLFIVADPKLYKKDALFFELFNQVKDLSSDPNSNYSVAVYNRMHLIKTSNNDFDFPDIITKDQVPRFEDTLINKAGYSQLWYNAGNNKIIVVVRKGDWFLAAFTIFSYLFCLFIALVILLHYSNLLFKTRFRWRNIQNVFSFNVRTQIQATIIAVSIFSFIVIGVITISFFIVSFNKDSRDRLTVNTLVIRNEMEEVIKVQTKNDSLLHTHSFEFTGDIKRKIIEIASVHNTDINFYNKDGRLEVSSQPYIYTKDILSSEMQPEAYYALRYNHSTQWIQDEHIGNITFLSIYVVVRDANGGVIAYLNVPSLNSQNELKLEINDFLVTLINLNALIFIIAGGIAILVTSRITSSFTLIGNKMKEISLGRINEEITWKRKDEIGTLVNEYNKMVRKLEQSAQALARSEREGAWREMARQVAHEIKNPLTPMKLSIQYLQRAINNNSSNVKELSQQVADTLIEQIEQLSKIAGDFSQFANIGNVTIENFDVGEVLASLINLFSADSSLNIVWNKPGGPHIIKADKMQINRLFTNLIKNAIEASGDHADVTVDQYIKGNKVIIAIKDNGTGIPLEMQQKIFTPNFTTKSSGTGLGLAICRGIVEKANGSIWFETEVGKGTVFYVSLPLVK